MKSLRAHYLRLDLGIGVARRITPIGMCYARGCTIALGDSSVSNIHMMDSHPFRQTLRERTIALETTNGPPTIMSWSQALS